MKQEITSQVRRGVVKWIVQASLGLVAYGLILFLAAGRIDWIWGWAQIMVLAAFLAAHPLLLVPINPELLIERQKGFRDEGVKPWDKWLAGLAAGSIFPAWVVAGLDVRFGWTGDLPIVLHLVGLLAYELFDLQAFHVGNFHGALFTRV